MTAIRIQLSDTGINRRDLIDANPNAEPLLSVENIIRAIVAHNVLAGRDWYKTVRWAVQGVVENPRHTAFILTYRLPQGMQPQTEYLVVGIAYRVQR